MQRGRKTKRSVTPLIMGTVIGAVSMIFAAPVVAQTGFEAPPQQAEINVSDGELASFADAMGDLQEIQFEAQTEVNEMVESSELDTARFNEIHNALNNPEFDMPADVTDGERDTYESLIGSIGEVEQAMQADIQTVVSDAGLEVERFNEIAMAVQSDPELFERLQEYMQ
ncbi:MAG: DUF4168 domain-containing protein [Spirochaetaceae bacterium]|nr:MAG: DUF4168 domain-containing protein [Spirochaetaceae bacterium]